VATFSQVIIVSIKPSAKLSDWPPPYNVSYGHSHRNMGSVICPLT
ncbi:uncharacterized protein METZ01_LOCUS91768, partial [marine metagenome]